MLRFVLAAALFFVPRHSLAAQSETDKVRILVWYARLVASSALTPSKIVFVLPSGAPDNPKLERQLPMLRLALQQAGVPTTPEARSPGRDTILVLLSAPEPDSVAGDWTHYTLYSSQTHGPPSSETAMYVSRLLCSLKQCFFLSLQPVGRGQDVEIGMSHSLPPNKQLLQTPQTLNEGAHVLRHVRQS